MKLDFRARTTYTITKVTEPTTLDSEDFRNVEPPFTGETEEEFYNYISETLSDWEVEDFLDNNKDKFSEDERILGQKDYIYLFDNDQDGMIPNVNKIISKSNNKEIGFFVNPSNVSTSDFIDEAVQFKSSNSKYLNIKDNDLVFCCVPENENLTKNFSSNIDLFIKDRIKKKKLIKFKVPNGIYDICETAFVPILFESIAEFFEPGELIGHCIIKKDFNIKKRKRKK